MLLAGRTNAYLTLAYGCRPSPIIQSANEKGCRFRFLMLIVVAGMVMVVIIPIAVCTPAAPVFVPPAVGVRPAVFTRLVQFPACVYCLAAFPSVMFGGFVDPVISPGDAPLACSLIRAKRRCTKENERTSQPRRRKPRADPK